MAMAERRNVEFAVEGGATLRGWLFVSEADGPAPSITMAHGYAGVRPDTESEPAVRKRRSGSGRRRSLTCQVPLNATLNRTQMETPDERIA